MNQYKRIHTMWETDITVEYNPGMPEFGVFLDVLNGENGASHALVEIERKKARKLAKAILKMTRKGK